MHASLPNLRSRIVTGQVLSFPNSSWVMRRGLYFPNYTSFGVEDVNVIATLFESNLGLG